MTRPMPKNHYEELQSLRKKSTRLSDTIAGLEAKLERVQLFCERAVNFYPDLRDDYEEALEDVNE